MGDKIKRGEIYYIDIPFATGHEMEKGRPGIIVSCDALNSTSPCVAVVMCSASNKRDLPEHIVIRSTPLISTAMCEHIYTVDKSRVGKWCGRCSKSEMAALDIGIMAGLGLGAYDLARPQEDISEPPPPLAPSAEKHLSEELMRAQTERDIYKGLYERLLDSMTMERRASA